MLPLIQGRINIILTVFGSLGILGGIRDLNSFKDMQQLKAQRIKHNINKISGGYIAAVTTFLIVNLALPGYWAWFLTTVTGSIFTTYYNIKLRNKLSQT